MRLLATVAVVFAAVGAAIMIAALNDGGDRLRLFVL
jgi:hypothetical protein